MFSGLQSSNCNGVSVTRTLPVNSKHRLAKGIEDWRKWPNWVIFYTTNKTNIVGSYWWFMFMVYRSIVQNTRVYCGTRCLAVPSPTNNADKPDTGGSWHWEWVLLRYVIPHHQREFLQSQKTCVNLTVFVFFVLPNIVIKWKQYEASAMLSWNGDSIIGSFDWIRRSTIELSRSTCSALISTIVPWSGAMVWTPTDCWIMSLSALALLGLHNVSLNIVCLT